MDFNARFYDPYLNRWTQPDSVIPELLNSQAWNRFSYTINNPIIYVDPSGHEYAGPCIDGENCYDPSGGGSFSYSQSCHGIECDIPELTTGEDSADASENAAGSAGVPAFDPIPAPDWMPGFMADAWFYAQMAISVLNNPNAAPAQKAHAGAILGGYIVGYGGLLVGASMLGYAGAQAIINVVGLACVGNPTCAALAGLSGVASGAACADGDCTNEVSSAISAACADGDCTNEVNFVVSENGNVYPLPPGTTGPTTTINGQGIRWETTSLGFRIMNPNQATPYPYANYYKILPGGSYQTINPLTGQTPAPNDIMWHIPLNGTWAP